MTKGNLKSFVFCLFIMVVAFFTFVEPAEAGNQYGHVKQELEVYFKQLNEEGALNGSVIVVKDDKVLLKKGYGLANVEEGIPNNPMTVFCIGSMTKAFTAVSILMLEERGLLNVNDTIDRFVPEYPNGNLVTIHNLLNHTGGIYLYANNPESGLFLDYNWTKFHTPDDLMQYFMYENFCFEAGSQFMYSNSGYVILGAIIERVSGMTFNEFIQTNICEPLGMKHTFYDPYEVEWQNKIAVGYDVITPDSSTAAMYLHPSVAYTAGGIFSTVKDLARWDQGLFTGKLVSMNALEKMFTPGLDEYGYGWWITTLENNGEGYRHIWHSGGFPGYHSFFSRIADENLTIIILTNTTTPPTFDINNIREFDLKLIADEAALMVLDHAE